MGFLTMGFVAKRRNNTYAVKYDTQIILQIMPFMFTRLVIVTLHKYKLKLHHSFMKTPIPTTTTNLVYALLVLTVAVCVTLPMITIDKHLGDETVRLTNIFV